jgi:hypothetical protein
MLPLGYSRLPGQYNAQDQFLFRAGQGEHTLVLTPNQWRVAAPRITPALKQANVPGFAQGGSPNFVAPNTSTEPDVFNVTFQIDTEGLMKAIVKSPTNRKVIFRTVDMVYKGKSNAY